jgi:xanthine dehydrogenase accessory factor
MRDWAKIALALTAAGEPAALVTVLAVEGSTPREAGARMLVWADGATGTIGGGALEQQACDQARRMLALAGGPAFAIQDYPLGPLLAQCCGGRVRLLIERLDRSDPAALREIARLQAEGRRFELRRRLGAGIYAAVASCGAPGLRVNGEVASARGPKPAPGDLIVEPAAPPRPSVLMFGAGHVGQAIARALAPLPLDLRWYDCRDDVPPHPALTIEPRDRLIGRAASPADFILVLTHDHALDYALVAAALAARGDGYLGLIGSKTKRARFFSRLRADGLGPQAEARLVCPIGLPGLGGKAPEVIAASVAADLLIRAQALRAPAIEEPALASL